MALGKLGFGFTAQCFAFLCGLLLIGLRDDDSICSKSHQVEACSDNYSLLGTCHLDCVDQKQMELYVSAI